MSQGGGGGGGEPEKKDDIQILLNCIGIGGCGILTCSILRNNRKRRLVDVCLFSLTTGCLLLSTLSLIKELQEILVLVFTWQSLAMCLISLKNICIVFRIKGFTLKAAWIANLLILLVSCGAQMIATNEWMSGEVWTLSLASVTMLWILLSCSFVIWKTHAWMSDQNPTTRSTLHLRSFIFILVFCCGWFPLASPQKEDWLEWTSRAHSLMVVLAYGWHNTSLERCLAHSRACRNLCFAEKYSLKTTRSNRITVTTHKQLPNHLVKIRPKKPPQQATTPSIQEDASEEQKETPLFAMATPPITQILAPSFSNEEDPFNPKLPGVVVLELPPSPTLVDPLRNVDHQSSPQPSPSLDSSLSSSRIQSFSPKDLPKELPRKPRLGPAPNPHTSSSLTVPQKGFRL
jgi:hypothetical protein